MQYQMQLLLLVLVFFAATVGGFYLFRFSKVNRALHDKNMSLEKDLWRTQVERDSLEQRLNDSQKNSQDLKEQLRLEFEKINRGVLDASQEKLKVWSQETLQRSVEPVDVELKQLKQKISDVYDREARERIALRTEIEFMLKAQNQLSHEAQSLTKALRGDVRVQGVWGEMILERILNASGLRAGEEYVLQGQGLGLKAEAGHHQKPDVLVRLPGERHIIIDSKVSLQAFEHYMRETTDLERARALDEYLKSVRRHLNELSEKDYSALYGINSPDFVLMFIPTDGAFALAHQSDPQLFSQAMEKKIAIVSPSLLFPNLRTVEAIWRREKQSRNSEEIARQAGGLYDKFVSLAEDIETLGGILRRADETQVNILGKLKSGKGNLFDRVEKLRRLGARTKKKLDSNEIPEELSIHE